MNRNFDIDHLVQQIWADLTVMPEIGCTKKENKETEKFPVVDTVVINPLDEVHIDSKVVSLAEIRERMGNATKLFISPKSILTPSAKDEIRKRKIEVAVQLPTPSAVNTMTLWVALHKPVLLSSYLEKMLRKEFEVKQDSFSTLPELFDETEKQLSNENLRGVVLTKQSATVMLSASRYNIFRTIMGMETKQTAEDATEINANLLIVHPQRVAETKIMELVRSFVKRR